MAKKLKNTTPEIDEWDEFEFFDLDNFNDLAEDTKDKSGLRYIKNVFKSVKNVSVKLSEALLPQTSGLAGELKNAGSEFKDQFTEFKDKALNQISKFKGKASGQSLSKEAIGETASSLFTDLKKDIVDRFKTGKFVKGPEDESFDMDFGFGGDDDDDESSSSSSEPQSTLKQEKDPNAPVRARITQAKNRNKRLQFDLDNERFQSLKEATLGASEASVAASIEMFNKSQMLEEARHHVTTQYLKNMAVNIYKLTGIQGQALAADIEYGKKTLALYADMTRFIKEMHEMQSIVHRENEKFRSKNKSTSGNKLENIFGYGFSGSEWAKGIIGNVKDAVEMSPIGMMMGMLPMLDMMNMGGGGQKGGVGGTIKNFAKSMNPFSLLLNLVMSSQMKRSRERIEKLFGALPALINQRFVSVQDEGGLKGLIGTILGIRDTEGVVKTEKFSNMNLDSPTSFDVRSKRALTEVIPLRLARIEAALTGKEETRYDYRTGKFKTVGSIQREKENIKAMAMSSDLDFSEAVSKINSLSGVSDKKTIDALNAMHMQLVNLQQGFDWNRFNEISDGKLTNDAKYYRNLIASKVKGSQADKDRAIDAFAKGYEALKKDKDGAAFTRMYLAGMPIVKSAYGRGLNNWAETLNSTTEGGLNTISTGQHSQSIKKLKDELLRLQKIRDDDTVAFSRNQINKKIAETQMKLAQLSGESGGGFLNMSTVDIENQAGYQMEQKFMSVPNMLKNITEILLHGIVVYPSSTMPKEVMSFMGSQKSYLSNEAKRAADAVQTQLAEEQRAREEVNEANLKRMQMRRTWTQKETGLAATGFGRWINKGIGNIYNLFNQAILSPLGGFDGTYDFNETDESRENSQQIYDDRSGTVRKFALKLSEKQGVLGKFGNILLGLTANVDNAIRYTGEEKKEESELATKVISKFDKLKNAVANELEKHPFLAEKAHLVKKMLVKEPDTAQAVIKEIEKGVAEGKSASEIIDQVADNTLDEEFYKQLSFMKGMKGSKMTNKSKVVDKSVSNSYNKIKKITNVSMNTKPIEEKLDTMIEILKAQQTESGYRVSGMNEVISLLVTLNAPQMASEELQEVSNAIKKVKDVKNTLVSRIVGLPKYVAGKAKDAVIWTGDKAVGGFNQVMKWGGQMLPGIGAFGRGVLGEAWNNVKAFGKQIPGFFGGVYAGAKSVVGTGVDKASELLNQAKTRVRAELDNLAENGGLNIETLLSKFSREELIEKLASVTGKSPEELANLDNKELAAELIKFWKSRAGTGVGGLAEGLGNLGKGALGFGSESIRGIGQNIYDAGKSALSGVGGFLSSLVGPNGSLISIGGGNSNKNLIKALLANTIAIRTMMETHYGIPSHMESASSEAEKISKATTSRAGFSKIGSMFKGFGTNLGNSRLAQAIKKKLPGHVDRGDGSGIAEGSYEDYKRDMQEAKVEQREENKEDYLAQIAANTAHLAGLQNVGGKEQKEKIKPNLAGLSIAGGAALVAGGAALFAGNFLANKKKKEQYQASVENGSMTQEEANREGRLDNVEKGNMMARSVVMAIKGVDKILNVLFKMKPLNKFITGPTKNIIQKSITTALTKFAPRIGPRLAAFIGIGAGSAGISTAIQAAAGFVWGMARASSYFKDILGPGQKITLAMRVTAGLVKALDFALMGIPDIICTFMGTNPVMWIYNMIKDVIGGPSSDNGKWLKQRADIYGLKSAKDVDYVINNKNNSSWKKLGFKSKKIFDEWYSRRFEPLYQLEEQLSGGREDIMDGSCQDQAAVENFRKSFISKARQLIERENIGHLTYASSENDLGTAAAGAAVIGGAAAGATLASKVGGTSANTSTATSNQLSEMNPESTSGETPSAGGPLAMLAAGATVGEIAAKHKGMNPSDIPSFYYANVASLANLIAIRKILEIQSGIPIRIEDAQLEAEKIASTGGKMSNSDSGTLKSAIGSIQRKSGGILSKVGGFFGSVINKFSGATEKAGENLQEWASTQSSPTMQKVGTAAGTALQKVGQGIQTIYEKGKGFLMSNPLTKNLFPQHSPSPYLIPNTQSSAGGARADINNVNPELRNRLVAFAQHYYDITGKPLKITSGKRTLQQQIKLWEAESKVKWTGDRAKDTEATIKAGGKFYNVNGGTVGYPNPNAAHIMGRGIDIDINSTPYASEVDAVHRHWLFDDILEKYGLRRTLVRANGYTGSSLERWHIAATNQPVDLSALQNEQPPEASLKEQMIDEIPIQVGVKSSTTTSSAPSHGSTTQSQSQSSSGESSYSQNTTGSVSSYSGYSSSSVSSNTGINDTHQQMGEIGGLVKIMEKIEENTKRSADILAEHLPKLGNIFQLLGAILQATVNNGMGGSGGGQNEADMAAAIIAKANY